MGALAATTYSWVQIPFLKFTLQAGQCKWGPPLAGVYLSGRLRLLDRCRTVSGTVDCTKVEPDGDVHVRLRLDPQYVGLLKPANELQTCTGHPGPQGRAAENWAEIHPVWGIRVDQPATPGVQNEFGPEFGESG